MPGEQLGEQPGLHDARVLVFVEQHDAVLLAEVDDDPRRGADDLQCERHLVGELDESATTLGLGELLREVE